MVAILLIVGSGRWFTPKLTVEKYFNESVQGLDRQQAKYRGVEIGSARAFTFNYTRLPARAEHLGARALRLVEAEIQPGLLGGRAAAGDLTQPRTPHREVDRGLRVRLAPQGLTGTNYLEIDYVEAGREPGAADGLDADQHLHPSARSTVTTFVDAATEIVDRLHNLDIEGTVANLNRLMARRTNRIGATIDTKSIATQTERTLAKIENTMDGIGREAAQQRDARAAEGAAAGRTRAQGHDRRSAWR